MPRLKRIIFFGSYAWGDAMSFLNKQRTKAYGWKPYRFSDYEIVAIKIIANEPKAPAYVLYNVEWQDDPKDMFFADCKLIGYVPAELIDKDRKKLEKLVLGLYSDHVQHGFLYRLYKRLFKKRIIIDD